MTKKLYTCQMCRSYFKLEESNLSLVVFYVSDAKVGESDLCEKCLWDIFKILNNSESNHNGSVAKN